MNILHNNEDVDECLNDVRMCLWNSIPPQKPASLRAWLARITRNLSLNRYKQKNTSKRGAGEMDLIFDELEECIPSANQTEDEWEMKLLTEQINVFMKTLSRENQIVFARRYLYSDSVQTIATGLRIGESKVKTMLFRSRKKLKEHLEREGVVI